MRLVEYGRLGLSRILISTLSKRLSGTLMKTINVSFSEDEFKQLLKKKPRRMSWHDFIVLNILGKVNLQGLVPVTKEMFVRSSGKNWAPYTIRKGQEPF